MSTLKLITIENFKCFREASFHLGGLTLLAGINSTGKSSLIQALLLLRQSHEQGYLANGELALNGELTQIGGSQDALFEDADPAVIAFSLRWKDDRSASWRWAYSSDKRTLSPHAPEADVTAIDDRPPFSMMDFCYLAADRIPPSSAFPVSHTAVESRRNIGIRGEFTAHFLSTFHNEQLPCKELRRPEEPDFLLRQVEAWLNVIRPGLRLEVVRHDFTDVVELAYKFRVGRQFGGRYRSTNVGFGLTYVMPVIVALLSAPRGGLVIIENPEAHLHPRGQSQIGALCALAAAAGVQVIVETHSDHILNGIRVAVRGGRLAPEDVVIHFFAQQDTAASPETHSPRIDSDGRFDQWPEGFFDEWDHALDQLLS
jgi:predicted ATPase